MISVMSEEFSIELLDKCCQLCYDYVSVNRKDINRDNIVIKRIIGGITNSLYYCSFPTESFGENNATKEIALKIYRNNERPLHTSDSFMNDIIIGLILSENGLGPKIYGISNNAVIMQYIECHQFSASDQKNNLLVEELGRKLAKVHAMKPPINRNKDWFSLTFTEQHINAYKEYETEKIIKQNDLKFFIEHDFENEFIFLKKIIIKYKYPIVFSHNDFGFNNILVKDRNDSNDRIVLSDFEFSSYGFRGRDFGIIFNDWLHFHQMTYNRKSESIIRPFLQYYFDQSLQLNGRIFGQNYKNSVNYLVKESKIFLLLQKMFSVVYYLNGIESVLQESKINILKKANHYYEEYLTLKNTLIKEEIIN